MCVEIVAFWVVALCMVYADVSEELLASIFRVELGRFRKKWVF
jgi:hypothetical protein